jgi:hypothetical protein
MWRRKKSTGKFRRLLFSLTQFLVFFAHPSSPANTPWITCCNYSNNKLFSSADSEAVSYHFHQSMTKLVVANHVGSDMVPDDHCNL